MIEGFEKFLLGDGYVESGANRLVREGAEVRVESKVMAVLVHLARHQGELVTRQALEETIWTDTVVGYEALTGCIAKLRKVLGDDRRQPRYIETISKKGYRLIAEVSHPAAPSDFQGDTKREGRRQAALWTLNAAVLLVLLFLLLAAAMPWSRTDGGGRQLKALPALEGPSIVVLPFTHIGGGARDYFSDGITADITTALAKLSGIVVISPSSATDWEAAESDFGQIASAFGARYVLKGSVRRSGDRLRVNVHLLDAGTDVYLWSEMFERELRNIFAVQDEITANIVNALSIRLTEEEKRRIARRYTDNTDAYDDYLHGLALYARHTREDNLAAREYYQRAIDRDREFARAYGSMALTYVADHRNGWSAESVQLDMALALATQGIRLDEELPQAHFVLAYVHLFRKEYRSAAHAARRAIELEPNYADSYITLAVCKVHFGEPGEALDLVRRAMLLNPKYPAAYASVRGQIHFALGEYEEALSPLREAIHRNANLLTPHIFLVAALGKLERLDEAKWEAGQLEAIAPGFRRDTVAALLPIADSDTVQEVQKQLRRVGL